MIFVMIFFQLNWAPVLLLRLAFPENLFYTVAPRGGATVAIKICSTLLYILDGLYLNSCSLVLTQPEKCKLIVQVGRRGRYVVLSWTCSLEIRSLNLARLTLPRKLTKSDILTLESTILKGFPFLTLETLKLTSRRSLHASGLGLIMSPSPRHGWLLLTAQYVFWVTLESIQVS